MGIHTALDMNAPGADSWIQITDFGGGWNPMLLMNPLPLAEFAAWFEGQFRGRLKLAIFVDMPAGFGPLMKMMIKFLKPATREKIRICSYDEAVDLLHDICDLDVVSRYETCMENRREGKRAEQLWHPIVDMPWFHRQLEHLQL